jgi:hypothetical protein
MHPLTLACAESFCHFASHTVFITSAAHSILLTESLNVVGCVRHRWRHARTASLRAYVSKLARTEDWFLPGRRLLAEIWLCCATGTTYTRRFQVISQVGIHIIPRYMLVSYDITLTGVDRCSISEDPGASTTPGQSRQNPAAPCLPSTLRRL